MLTKKYVVVAPDEGALKKANSFAMDLNLSLMVISKERDYSKLNQVERMTIIGDPVLLQNKTAIIVDDMCDTFGTIQTVSKILTEVGAKDIIVAVTHGVLSGPALERLQNSKLKELVITDSIAPTKLILDASNIRIINLAPLIAEAIRRISSDSSVSSLFD